MSLHPEHHGSASQHNFELNLISYGHSNGSLVLPDKPYQVRLFYSVCDVPNPPKLLRKKHTGRSRRLQEEIFLSKQGKARLEQILESIETQINQITEDYSRAPTPEIRTDADLDLPKDSPRELLVGIMCEEGRHRSVAFAEELGKRVTKRPRWVVDVRHRDLGEIGSSEDDEEEEEDGNVSPTFGRRSAKIAKQKDKEKKKMHGRKISSFVEGDF